MEGGGRGGAGRRTALVVVEVVSTRADVVRVCGNGAQVEARLHLYRLRARLSRGRGMLAQAGARRAEAEVRHVPRAWQHVGRVARAEGRVD